MKSIRLFIDFIIILLFSDRGKIGEMYKCEFEGKTYKEGERIYPDSEQCYECLCAQNFNATLKLSENPNCMLIDCGIELRNLKRLRDGCIPIYFKNGCCPIEFKCRKLIISQISFLILNELQ